MMPGTAPTHRAGSHWAAALAFLLLCSPLPAGATTYLVGSDADLLAGADSVVIGTVETLDRNFAGGAETLVVVRVLNRLRGEAADTLAVRLPGGSLDGQRRVVFGVPELAPGGTYVLFLRELGDGTWAPVDLALGVYAVEGAAGAALAVRDLGHARALAARHGRLHRRGRREVRRLRDLLASVRADGGDYGEVREVELPNLPGGTRADFTFLTRPPARWIQPDTRQPIVYLLDPDNAAETGVDGVAAVDAALEAWTSVDCSSARVERALEGTPAPFGSCDGLSQILFEDPFDEIGAPRNCSGLVGLGGYCTISQAHEVNGTVFERITEADVVLADGYEECDLWTSTNVAEALTHEIGHTLGLGHSSEKRQEGEPALRDATMYYRAQFDGRGASLRSDDEQGICFAYPIPPIVDSDQDGVQDDSDNCVGEPNPGQENADLDDQGDACDSFTLVRLMMTSNVVHLAALVRLDDTFEPARDVVELRLVTGRGTNFRAVYPAGGFKQNASGTFFRGRRRGDGEVQTLTLVARGGGLFLLQFRSRGVGYSGAATSVDRVRLNVDAHSVSTPVRLERDGNGTYVFP